MSLVCACLRRQKQHASPPASREADSTLKFNLLATCIDDQKKQQGVLITLDDVTQLEEKNFQLRNMVTKLEVSQKVVLQQNRELQYQENYLLLSETTGRIIAACKRYQKNSPTKTGC